MKPLVTVITPTYNCAKYIQETVESVLFQGYPSLEYIVLDDGSTDNTQEVLKKYEKHLTVIRHKNMGEHLTVNEGLKRVNGKYFMYPNADDPLLPGAISELVEAMEYNPEVLCAYCDWDAINEDGTLRLHVKPKDYDFIYMVRHHTCLPSVGSMFRSTVIDKVGYRDPQFRWVSDFDYWLRIGLAGPMVKVPKTLACWRHRAGQGSKDKSNLRALDHIRLIQKFYSLPGITPELLKVKQEAICWSYLVAASVVGNNTEVIGYIRKAISAYPRQLINMEFWDALIQRAKYILRR